MIFQQSFGNIFLIFQKAARFILSEHVRDKTLYKLLILRRCCQLSSFLKLFSTLMPTRKPIGYSLKCCRCKNISEWFVDVFYVYSTYRNFAWPAKVVKSENFPLIYILSRLVSRLLANSTIKCSFHDSIRANWRNETHKICRYKIRTCANR